MYREGLFEHHRRDNLALLAAGATPVAFAYLGPVPEGYCWYVENIAWAVGGNSHTALIDAAVTPDNGPPPAQAAWDHAGLFYATTAAAVMDSRNFAAPVKIDPSHYLLVYLYAGTLAAADAAVATIFSSVHQLSPQRLMSPEDERQVRAARERIAGPVTMVATAGERAV